MQIAEQIINLLPTTSSLSASQLNKKLKQKRRRKVRTKFPAKTFQLPKIRSINCSFDWTKSRKNVREVVADVKVSVSIHFCLSDHSSGIISSNIKRKPIYHASVRTRSHRKPSTHNLIKQRCERRLEGKSLPTFSCNASTFWQPISQLIWNK